MRKFALILLPFVLAVIAFLIFLFFVSRANGAKGALQVTSVPVSNVYLNGKPLGKTPLCNCDPQQLLPTGEYSLKLIPIDSSKEPYEEKITINPSVLTVVDRTFGDIGKSSGSIIGLDTSQDKKNASIFVTSFPYGADVAIDSVPVGTTPFLKQITESDHEITVAKTGYKQKIIRVHGVIGYKLSVTVYLSTEDITSQIAPTTQSQASAAAQLQTTIIILSTPTGFLRVRDNPSLSGKEISQVHPGDTFPFVSEQDGWFQIKLSDGSLGWINNQYAKKQ